MIALLHVVLYHESLSLHVPHLLLNILDAFLYQVWIHQIHGSARILTELMSLWSHVQVPLHCENLLQFINFGANISRRGLRVFVQHLHFI
jgi:hypothetical protein